MRFRAMALGLVMLIGCLGALATPSNAWTLPIPDSVEYTGYGDLATGYPTGTQWLALDEDIWYDYWSMWTIEEPAPGTSIFFNEYPYNVAGNGYNYQSNFLYLYNLQGWYENRFGMPAPADDAYEYYHLKIYLEYRYSNAFSLQDRYYYGIMTDSGQNFMKEIYAYGGGSGSTTNHFWANASPDSGEPWTKAEIGALEFRLAAWLNAPVASDMIAYRVHTFAIPTDAPAYETGDLILRPDGDEFVGEGITPTPASPTTLFDKVNETDQFGDAYDTMVNLESAAAPENVVFSFTDVPEYWDEDNRFRLTVWIVARSDLLNYPDIEFGVESSTFGGAYFMDAEFQLPTAWSNVSYEWAANPSTGESWTIAQLNELTLAITISENSEVNITQVGALLTLTEGEAPSPSDDDAGWGSLSFANLRIWMSDGGISWLFLIMGGLMIVGTPAIAVLAYQKDGYVESLGKFLLIGFIGFGFFWVGVMTG